MSELALRRANVRVSEEPWATVWPDAAPLAAAHSIEVDGGVEQRRKHAPDTELMALMDAKGIMKVVTARDSVGNLLGYCTWNLGTDPESVGLNIAIQGAWFALPGTRVGGLMFDYSVSLLRSLGVLCIFPHHRMQGRGADLGSFFKVRGAKEIKREYILWIGA